jgi:hypothetical protein
MAELDYANKKSAPAYLGPFGKSLFTEGIDWVELRALAI